MDTIPADRFQKELRATLGCFPTGVAVVTALNGDGRPCGLTINSFSSVSLNPPLILWSLDLQSASLPVFQSAAQFTVNILAADQTDICQHFAGPGADRFNTATWQPGPTGLPHLDNVTAWLDCRTYKLLQGGDHLVIFGEVTAHYHEKCRPPLVFSQGQFTQTG